MMPSDEELMLRIKEEGDEQAFGMLIQRYRKPILNFVYRFLGNEDMAEDISQDVFLRLWGSASTYLPLAKFTTFLYTIARNLCLNALAKMKNTPTMYSLSNEDMSAENQMQVELATVNNSPEDELMRKETEERIKYAIDKLSPDHRLVFILTEFHDLSYQDVASIVQCPVGTVASRKNAAVKHLRDRLSIILE